jgi:hypothetical protein
MPTHRQDEPCRFENNEGSCHDIAPLQRVKIRQIRPAQPRTDAHREDSGETIMDEIHAVWLLINGVRIQVLEKLRID